MASQLNAVYIMNTFWIWMDDFTRISIGVKFNLADSNCLPSTLDACFPEGYARIQQHAHQSAYISVA